MTLLEIVAVAMTIVAVFLTTRQIIWCWPLGMLSVVLYAAVFFEARLYAEVGLQTLYFVLSAYGWWAWQHGAGGSGGLAVTVTPTRQRLLLVGAGAGGGLLLGLLLHRFTDAALPFMDSALAAFSIVAQWMQTRKLLEAWLLWIAVDLFYVGMFARKGLYPTAALYAAFLGLAYAGYVEWKRSMTTPVAA